MSRCQTVHLKPVASAVVRDLLVDRYAIEPDDAELLARLSGGRVGWAIGAAQNPEALDARNQALDILETALRGNRKERFDLANDLSRDKLALPPLLELWQAYWRDVLLMTEQSPVKPVNIDRQVTMEQLMYSVEPADALAALKATQAMLKLLDTNANVRLGMEVMFLDYPGLER